MGTTPSYLNLNYLDPHLFLGPPEQRLRLAVLCIAYQDILYARRKLPDRMPLLAEIRIWTLSKNCNDNCVSFEAAASALGDIDRLRKRFLELTSPVQFRLRLITSPQLRIYPLPARIDCFTQPSSKL